MLILNLNSYTLCALKQRKSNEAEVESLREEYHQRVATLERKVYFAILVLLFPYKYTFMVHLSRFTHSPKKGIHLEENRTRKVMLRPF